MWHLFNKYSGHRPIPAYREDLAKRIPKYVLKGVVDYITDSITSRQSFTMTTFWNFKITGCHLLIGTAWKHRCHPVSATTYVLGHWGHWCHFFPHLVSDIWPLERSSLAAKSPWSPNGHWWSQNSLTETGNGMGGQKLKAAWAKAESQATWKISWNI